MDQLTDAVLITDIQRRIEYVNDAFVRITGYGPDEVIGQPASFLTDPSEGFQFSDDLWRSLQDGEPFFDLLTSRKKSGETYRVGLSISPIRDDSATVRHFLFIGRDITENVERLDLNTMGVDRPPSAIYILQNGRFFYLNPQFQRMTGYGPEDLIGHEWWELVPPEDRPMLREAALAMGQGQTSTPHEFRFITRSGEVRWALETVSSVLFRNERAVAGNFVDVTDRKIAEDGLKQALSLYAATIESTADGILVIDLERKVVGFNQRLVDLWNLPHPPLIGASSREAFGQMGEQVRDPKAFRDDVAEAFSAREAEANTTLELNDGRVFEMYSKPQTIEGVAAGRVWSFRDVTARLELEQRLTYMADHDALTGIWNRRRLQ